MKKTILLLPFFLAFLSMNAYGQSKITAGYFQSYPLGLYGSTNAEDGSFAEKGWGFLLEHRAALPNFPDGLYLGFHYSYQHNEFNSGAFADALDKLLGQSFVSDVSESSYNPSVITLGPYYEFIILNKLSIELKTGAGILFTNIDPVSIDVYDAASNLLFTEELKFKSQASFTYLAGVSVAYNLSRRLRAGLFMEHSASKEKIDSALNNIEGVSNEFKISYLNAGINLSVLFN